MKAPFRQGLISFQTDSGNPVFLQASNTSGYVSHVVSPTPTRAAFAHGESDYLQVFNSSVDLAWGPLTPSVDNYLYWDIDLLTAQVTRGITTLIPVTSLTAPSSPANDQHWFDLNTTTMKVWSAARSKWYPKIRLFAGKVTNGNTNTIVCEGDGSQVGLDDEANPGFIMRDIMLNPLRKSSGEFLTDDEAVHVDSTVGTAGVLVQPVNRVVPVRAGESIPKMSLVYFSDEDTVRLASSNPTLVPQRIPVGIVLDALTTGDIGTLCSFGEISYDQWDWEGEAGKPVYIDYNGQVTLSRPEGLLAFRVGFVKNATTILFGVDAETYPQVYQAGTTDLTISGVTPIEITDEVNMLGERVVTIEVPVVGAANGLMTPAQATQLSGHETRLDEAEDDIAALETSKADVVHTHTIANVTGLQTALDGKADDAHAHAISDVTDLQDELDDKSNVGHTHAIADVLSLQATLNDKSNIGHNHDASYAALSHTHVIANVTGLQAALDGKSDVGHTHTIANVTGLQTALDDKAEADHTHGLDDLSDVDTSTTLPNSNDVLTWDGSQWIPQAPAGGDPTPLLTVVDNFYTLTEEANEGLYFNVAVLVLGSGLRVRNMIDKGNGSIMTVVNTSCRTLTFTLNNV